MRLKTTLRSVQTILTTPVLLGSLLLIGFSACEKDTSSDDDGWETGSGVLSLKALDAQKR